MNFFLRKKSHNAKNTERGTLRDFSTSILSQNIKKLKGGPLGVGGTLGGRGDPLVFPGIVCYAEKEEKYFWFSSLGQMIQFGTIKFRRTILVSSYELKKN